MIARSHSSMHSSRRFGLLTLSGLLGAIVVYTSAYSLTGPGWEGLPAEAGDPRKATLILPEGDRLLNLEMLPNRAMIRLAEGKSLASAGLASFVDGSAANPGAQLSLVSIKAGTPLAAASAASSFGASSALLRNSSIAFAGPVFLLGGRLVGVGDTLILQFEASTPLEAQKALIASHKLEVMAEAGAGAIWVVRIATQDGFDTLDKAAELSGAPGIRVAAVDWYSIYKPLSLSGGYTDQFGGTSSAAPTVAGIAALALSVRPDLTYAQVMDLLRATAQKIDVTDGAYDELGHSVYYGFGLANAKAALERATSQTATGPVAINDPLYPYQWHLSSDPISTYAVEEADIDAPEAWSISKGDPKVKIGVIDTGVDMRHEDLNVVGGYDPFTGQLSCQPRTEDIDPEEASQSHGTCVAGVIAAKTNNGKGVAGVANGLPVVGVRLIIGQAISDSQMFKSFQYVVDQGAWVINNSWGRAIDNDPCSNDDDKALLPITAGEALALDYALTYGRGGKGCVIVFAAGNDRANCDGDELNGHPNVLTVSAANNLAKRSWYSRYGNCIDVAGPTNDFAPESACDSSIWTGGNMSITTTDLQSATLPFLNLEGIGGYSDLTGIEAHTVVEGQEAIGFIGVAKNKRRIILEPVVLGIDARGKITGTMKMRTEDASGKVLASATLPIKGAARFSLNGTDGYKIKVYNVFSMSGSLPANGVSFSIGGKETYLFKSLDTESPLGFQTVVKANMKGFATVKFSATVKGFTRGMNSFYPRTVHALNASRTQWEGDAGIVTGFGTLTGGRTFVRLTYAKNDHSTSGGLKAYARNGIYYAYSRGNHWNAMIDNPDIYTINRTFKPGIVILTTPCGSYTLRYPWAGNTYE